MVPNNICSPQGEVCALVTTTHRGVYDSILKAIYITLLLSNILMLASSTAQAQIGYGKRWYPEAIYLEAETISATQVRLAWQISNQTQQYYGIRIYRANPLTPQYFEFVEQIQVTSVSYVDSNLKPNTTYSYQIRFTGKKPVMMSVPSNPVTLNTMDPNSEASVPTKVDVPRYTTQDPGVRSAIKTLVAKPLAGNKIELRWGFPRMNNVASLRIFRTEPENPTEFIFLDVVAANRTSWIDTTVYPQKSYSYILRYNIGTGAILSPPSNIATATTPDGDLPTDKPKYNRTNVLASDNPAIAKGIQGEKIILTPATYTVGNSGSAVPLDSREEAFLYHLNEYRAANGLGPLRVSINLTRGADEFAKELTKTGKVSKIDAQGRSARTRARAWGYDIPTIYDSVVFSARISREDYLENFKGYIDQFKSLPSDNAVLLNPIFKTVGLARAYSEDNGDWFWVLDFSAFWDYTIPLPGEDEEGRIDGNELIRTRPPSAALAEGHIFTGYGDDGKPYSTLHCDTETKACWKDPATAGNIAIELGSDPEYLIGTWHTQYQISKTGIKHFNDVNGYDLTEYTVNLQINKDGTWVMQGYRAYQRPTPVEAGTWKSVHDISANEELVTFYRDNGKPSARLRVHAAKDSLTFFVIDGGSEMQDFFKSPSFDYNKQDDPQVILTPGIGFLLAPHESFPSNLRCNTCPK
jgi:uncharacterized protein YkwD